MKSCCLLLPWWLKPWLKQEFSREKSTGEHPTLHMEWLQNNVRFSIVMSYYRPLEAIHSISTSTLVFVRYLH